MKKLEKRAILCLLCAAVLVIGLGIFIAEFAVKGSTWASYPANQHIYKLSLIHISEPTRRS